MSSVSRVFPRQARARASRWLACLSAAALCVGAAIRPVSAIQPFDESQGAVPKLSRSFVAPELQVQPDLEPSVSLAPGRYVPMKSGVAEFLQRSGGDWELRWDRRSDRPNLIQGSGIPLLPGKGNTLDAQNVGLAPGATPDLATVEVRLRDFIAANEDLLRVRDLEFRLDRESSSAYGQGDTHWFVELAQYAGGVRVDRAHLFFRISHGNIVQFGEELVAPVRIDTRPSIAREDAFKATWRELAFPAGTEIVETGEAGELLLLPTAIAGDALKEIYTGATGAGYAHRLAWRFVFRVNDDDSTYEVLFDAHAGSIIEVRNLTVNIDATVTGGIYPTTNTDPEVVRPMPFAAVTNGGAKITDVLGIYDYSGGSATTALDGKYFKMADNCGAISLSNSTDGNLALGTSGGTDCTTPGVGGAGNTHASRTGFYHLTNINRKAVTFHPANSWLAGKVTANMNVNQTCNAAWSGGTLNFYKSGGGCSNTGEIAAVFLHEWGHGMDTNTGGAASENGSGEAVGDTFAFLETKDACIGKNFKPGVPCYNCDNTCTGVRDVEAFSTHGAATIAKPSTITATTGAACARWACPYLQSGIFPYQGPMGYEGHCESYIASSANWDLTQALIDKFGPTQGWQEMDRIWYGSLIPSKSAYRIASGGTCNVNAQVDGCGANNWYTVFLAADDDDGNLANGTPNACRIWDAFNAHGIACGTRPVCSADAPDFTIGVPNPSQAICAPGSATYTIDIGAQMGFANPVNLAAAGAPTGVTATFSPNPVAPGGSSVLTLNATGAAAPGISTIGIDGTASGSPGHSASVQLQITSGIPATPNLTAPANNANGTARSPTFAWAADAAALSYTIEVATDSAFATLVASGNPVTNSWTPATPLAPMTTYWWRVKANSPCGNSATSPAYTFTTGVTFPEPYCSVGFSNAVEPITRVKFTGIDNPSSATVGGTPALEDFLGVAGGAVVAGQSYAIAVEGNTAGTFHTYVTAYIDWNRDGTFGAGEKFDIGDLYNSTGADGKQVTTTIGVPAGALAGATRLRVIKKYSSSVAYPGACNVDGYGQAEDYTIAVQAAGPTYTVGGSVTGASGTGLKLRLNGGSDYAIPGNGPYTFPDALPDGGSYAVTVSASPAGQSCAVSGGSGTIGGSNVTNANVNCTALPTYSVGGNVGGLAGAGLTLKLNGGSDLAIAANGSFAFPGALASGSAYAVTIGTQPGGQTCTVANGSGTIANANVTNVDVTCGATPTYTIGGHVTGTSGAGLKLRLNGGPEQAIAGDGAYTFPDNLGGGTAYVVVVAASPAGQTCTVANGTGTVANANVTNVDVTCAGIPPQNYTVGGRVRGLAAAGLVLKLNDGPTLAMSANGLYAFSPGLPAGAAYAVTVQANPAGQACSVQNGSGTMGAADVTDVDVDCAAAIVDSIFKDGFELPMP